MVQKKIAVITPVHNAANYIVDCLQSVQHAVTAPEFSIEHIVVDDASTDETASLVKLRATSTVHLIQSADRRGPAAARNIALQSTDADYIFCLDADDIIFQNSLRTLFMVAERNTKLWLYGDFLRVGQQLNYQMGQDYYGSEFESPAAALTAMLSGQHFFQQNSFYRHSLLSANSFFDESLRMAEDFDLAIRLLVQGHVPQFVPGPLYVHRFHDQNYTPTAYQSDPTHHQRDVAQLYAKYAAVVDAILSPEQHAQVRQYMEAV